MQKNTITIVGGGSSAHTVIPLLSNNNNNIVNLLTSKPKLWNKNIVTKYQLPNGEISKELEGALNITSKLATDVIPQSDIILFCMPVHRYRIALKQIAPFINKNKKVFIGTVYGQAGFNWMVNEIKQDKVLDNITTFAFGLIPWICRIEKYGNSGITYGAKDVNYIALDHKEDFSILNSILLEDISYTWFKKGHFILADNFISLTLSVDNQIIHPSRLYALYLESGGKWLKEGDIPLFYKDYNELSEMLLRKLDDDYSKIRGKIIKLFPEKKFSLMLNYLELERFSNNSDSESIMHSFINSKTLGQIKTPVVSDNSGYFIIDENHRFFYDDVFYGLCIAKWIAEKMNIKTKTIDKILNWTQKILDIPIIDNDKLIISIEDKFLTGIPSVYGFVAIHEIID